MQTEPLWIVPVAIGLIVAEALSDYLTHRKCYELWDTLTSFAISLMSIGTTMLCRGISFLYLYNIYNNSIYKIPATWWSWIFALILADFLGYWFHWLGHHSTFFWLAHSPHHSSEKFNLSTAIRTPVFNACFRFIFWTPLCLFGFQPAVVISIESFLFIYQFFIHTEYVRKLGWLEYIFNTPSHHRVHHGTNNQYIDRNFGCVFIIWDRIFHTYQEETIPAKYGIANRKASFNPYRIVIEEWLNLVIRLGRARDLASFLKIAFGPPNLKTTTHPQTVPSWQHFLAIMGILSITLMLLL